MPLPLSIATTGVGTLLKHQINSLTLDQVQVLDPDFRFKIGFGPRYEPPKLKLIEKRVEPIIPPGDQQHPRKMEEFH